MERMSYLRGMRFLVFVWLACASIMVRTQPVVLTFQVNMNGVSGIESVGIRGNAEPLSWDQSVMLSDPRGNGFYEVTVTFPATPSMMEYKFIVNETQWELRQDNRLLVPSTFRSLKEPLVWDRNFFPPENALPALSAESLEADLTLLERAFRELHPGRTRYLSSDQFDSLFADYRRRVSKPMSRREAYLVFSQLTASLRCGHTHANPYNQSSLFQNLVLGGADKLPLAFRWVDGLAFVTRVVYVGDQLPIGSEILAINGQAMATLRDTLMTLVKGDGSNDASRLQQLTLTGLSDWEAWDIYQPMLQPPGESDYTLRIRDPAGGQRDVDVPRIARAERIDAWKAAGLKLPYSIDDMWHYECTDDQIAVLTLGTFSVWTMQRDWQALLDSAFQNMASNKVRDLIIDVRGNEGGADEVLLVLARHLMREDARYEGGEDRLAYQRMPDELRPYAYSWSDEYLDWGKAVAPSPDGLFAMVEQDATLRIMGNRKAYAGRVYLLTDASNSSATFHLANIMRKTGRALLVGSTTGGSQRGITGGQIIFFRLPNSGIEIDIPLIATNFPGAPDSGLVPDWSIPPTLEAARNGTGNVLPDLLTRIRAKR